MSPLPLCLQLMLKKQGVFREITMPNETPTQAPPAAAMYAGYPQAGRMHYGNQTYQQYHNQGKGIHPTERNPVLTSHQA